MSTTVIDDTISTFTADPGAGRTAPAVTAVMANGHARLTAGPFNWDADLPNALGGGNQAPSPTAYLLGALAGCAVAFVHDTLAPQFGVEITDVKATARCRADLGGLFALEGRSPALTDLAIDIEIDSPSPADDVRALQQAWLDRCPIYLGLREANEVTVTFA